MRWESEWWGIMIVAETEEDEQFLRDLHVVLPKEATRCYEDGIREICGGNHNETILEFRR